MALPVLLVLWQARRSAHRWAQPLVRSSELPLVHRSALRSVSVLMSMPSLTLASAFAFALALALTLAAVAALVLAAPASAVRSVHPSAQQWVLR